MNGRVLALTFGLLQTALCSSVSADEYTLVPDRFVYCTTCHGVELRGNRSVDAPRLNGMEGWYVRSQLRAFKQGYRGAHAEDPIGMEMQPQASALTADGIDDATAFVTAVPRRSSTIEHTVAGDVAQGRTLYATCSACHGPEGQGSQALQAPALAGQSDWYLVRQLANYRSGARGYAAEDTAGAQMRAAAAVLASDKDIDDVVAFINNLPVN